MLVLYSRQLFEEKARLKKEQELLKNRPVVEVVSPNKQLIEEWQKGKRSIAFDHDGHVFERLPVAANQLRPLTVKGSVKLPSKVQIVKR